MKCKKANNLWMIVLAKGEKVVEKLTEFARAENIRSGAFNAIGAISDVEMAHYHLENKKYTYKKIKVPLEIISLMGTITHKDSDIVVHAHIAVGAEDFALYGGHLKEATVSVTCEVTFTEFPLQINRKPNPDIGLNLID